MKITCLIALLAAMFAATASAALVVYEPFNYAAGNLAGNVAPNGQTWQNRSATGTVQTQVVGGSLSWPGLALSQGNSVAYGTSTPNIANSDAFNSKLNISPSINSGSVYYSFIVTLNGNTTGGRTTFASLSTDNNVAAALNTDVGGNVAMPAGAHVRTVGGLYELGVGKNNGDAIASGAGAGTWQVGAPGTASTPTPPAGSVGQLGQTMGTPVANLPDTFFMVLKYTFADQISNNNDRVSMYVNPAASTFGDNTQENGTVTSNAATSSLYAALGGLGSATIDADAIRGFILNSHRQNTDESISVTFDELRIGTTWADVTPVVPEPASLLLGAIGGLAIGAGRLSKRRRLKPSAA